MACACTAVDYATSVSVTVAKFADVGDLVTHVFTIRNQGTSADVYSLEMELPSGWLALPIPNSVAVSAGAVGLVFVNVSVPRTAEAGKYEIILEAISQSEPLVSAQAIGVVEVQSSLAFELAWVKDLPMGQPGDRLRGSFTVTNTGNTPDQYQVEAAANPDWETILSVESFGLLPGESQVVEIDVLVAFGVPSNTQYVIRAIVTSLQDDVVTQSLVSSGRLAPPPPEQVGGSLFPTWMMSATFGVDCDADPGLLLRGSGSIEGFGDVDASFRVTIEGIEDASAKLDTGDWSVYLDGGTIAGPFLGVGGSPLFGGKIGDAALWRLLFTSDKKGFFGLWRNSGSSTKFVMGSDSLRHLSFQEFEWRKDFAGPASGFFRIAHATQTESGTLVGLGGSVTTEDWELTASGLRISPGFPNQTPRLELQARAALECPVPIGVAYSSRRSQSGEPPGSFMILDRSLNMSTRLEAFETLVAMLAVNFGSQQSDDTPQSTDTSTTLVSLALQWNIPVPWTVSATRQFTTDRIAGTTVSAQQFLVQADLELFGIAMTPSFSAQSINDGTSSTDSSSMSVVLEALGLSPLPTATFSIGKGTADGEVSLTWELSPDTEVVATWEASSCGAPSWALDVSATFPAQFPFCGPTMGRITGYVYIDENRDGAQNAGEQGAQGVLLTAGGREAITGAGGRFVFPPMKPGTYELTIKKLPLGLASGIEFPLPLVSVAGEETDLLIPLQPRNWVRGRVFHDSNRNGLQEANEPGVPGIRVLVRGAGFEGTVTTDTSGRFMVEVPPGAYTVEVDAGLLPERFETTTTEAFAVTISSYGLSSIEFGVYQQARPVKVTFGPPTASFTFAPESPRIGEPTVFDGSGSTAINVEIISYSWEFRQEDAVISLGGRDVEVVFPTAGPWETRLTVTDSNGLKGVSLSSIIVQNEE